MVFGYSWLDPLVVLWGTVVTVYLLARKPIKLMLYLPAFLSLYFFVPFISQLTLFQIVPTLILVGIFFKGGFPLPKQGRFTLLVLVCIFYAQLSFAFLQGGEDINRIILRGIYYLGIFALFLYSWQYCRDEEGYYFLLKGAALIAVIHAAYGLYQIIALPTGLPVRGIVRGLSGAQMAYEGEYLRINGLASEPKRLAYVLALGAMALFELSRHSAEMYRLLMTFAGAAILAISIMTFSGSYFMALAVLIIATFALYPKAVRFLFIAIIVWSVTVPIYLSRYVSLFDTLVDSYERRSEEVDVGLDGFKVYRQEFYAHDYIINNPADTILGLGIGRYNFVLNKEYGDGVGYAGSGTLVPLNSNFIEMVFDLGVPATLIFYGALLFLILRLYRRREPFLVLVLLFLAIQSFSILVLQFLAVFMGAALAKLMYHHKTPSGEPVSKTQDANP